MEIRRCPKRQKFTFFVALSNPKKFSLRLIYFSFSIFFVFGACGENSQNYEKVRPIAPKYHTQTNPGAWEKKAKEHEIRIRYKTNYSIEVTVPLESTMRPPHYIEVIALHDDNEKEIAVKKFKPSYTGAIAEFEIPNTGKQYYVVAKCNLHDMWMAPVPAPK